MGVRRDMVAGGRRAARPRQPDGRPRRLREGLVGRLSRWIAAAGLATAVGLVGADAAAAFDGFGDTTADSTYGDEIRLEVELLGGAPERLELLVRTPGDESASVFPVEPSGATATYVWNTSVAYVVPNTLVTYQWRAIDGD